MAAVDLRKMVHDLRNRIAPIRNVLYLLRLRGGDDPKLADAIAIIERQIAGMGQILDEVSEASQAAAAEAAAAADPAPPSFAEASNDAQRAGAARGKRILIADDSAAVCESFGAILRDLGHEVRAARDGQEAVDMATAWVPDFVMLDVNMPRINGYEAARRLRARFPSSAQSPSPMRLVMISGADLDSSVLEAARQAGFDQCLDKLLDFSALRKMLGE